MQVTGRVATADEQRLASDRDRHGSGLRRLTHRGDGFNWID